MELVAVVAIVVVSFLVGWFSATGFGKGQYVRLVDIFLYGPYLIYIGMKKTYTFSLIEQVFLLFLGATTITYNARNYLEELN
jgi:hypothetical protein